MTEPLKRYELIMADLLAAIVRDEYPDGSLPKEQELAESYGFSRTTARQAIQALKDRGLVSVRHGVGQFVGPRHEWNLFDPLLFRGMLAGPDAPAARAEAREGAAIVWPEVAALAAARRTEEELTRLEAAADPQDVRNALVAAAHNRFLGQAASTLDRAGGRTPARKAYAPVIDAVREREPDRARTAMASLLPRPKRR